jgi:hypothetical protein
LGTGGVGGYFGGRLAQGGEDVVFIARGKYLEAMRTHGLRVDSIKGDFVIKPVQVTDDPKQVGAVDMVFVGVKAWQVPEAAQAMRPMVGPGTFHKKDFQAPWTMGGKAPTPTPEGQIAAPRHRALHRLFRLLYPLFR